MKSFQAAHSLILKEEAQLTTLTACVVVPVKEKEAQGLVLEPKVHEFMVFQFHFFSDDFRFAACVCNVGDSLAYVYSPRDGRVREITLASHDIQSNR